MGETKTAVLFVLPIAKRWGGGPLKAVEGPRGSAENAARTLADMAPLVDVAVEGEVFSVMFSLSYSAGAGDGPRSGRLAGEDPPPKPRG